MDDSLDFTDIDFDNFIREQDAKNTIKGNMSAWRCISKYLLSIGEKRAIELIPPIELDKVKEKLAYR